MNKTCFVIMGYGIKNNFNLDQTYEKIIKPCIRKNNLIPFPLYDKASYNAYRCDEISGTLSIDYKFVTCLNGADIVIADISTMNINAIYELGARHALKPRTTILLCAKEKEKEFKFFDITYVPIIFYEHSGAYLNDDVICKTKKQLNKLIDFSINLSSEIPDSPIYRALNEKNVYDKKQFSNNTIYQLYKRGCKALDDNDFDSAKDILYELYLNDSSEENLLLLVLVKYKISEKNNSCKGLIDCINFIKENVDVDNSTSEDLYGRLAAISLRIFNISGETEYYYMALEYYRKGSNFCKKNLYCPRNYCALLLRIFEVTEDKNIIIEYYYTAKHFAKLYLNMSMDAMMNGTYTERIYYTYNKADLRAIINNTYADYNFMVERIKTDSDVTKRQKETILEGISKLKITIEKIQNYINSNKCQKQNG